MKNYPREDRRQKQYFPNEYLPRQDREYLRRRDDYYDSFPRRENYSQDWSATSSHWSETHSQRRNQNFVETSTISRGWEDFERDSHPSGRREEFPARKRTYEGYLHPDPATSSRGRDWEKERQARNLTQLSNEFKQYLSNNRDKSPSVGTCLFFEGLNQHQVHNVHDLLTSRLTPLFQ